MMNAWKPASRTLFCACALVTAGLAEAAGIPAPDLTLVLQPVGIFALVIVFLTFLKLGIRHLIRSSRPRRRGNKEYRNSENIDFLYGRQRGHCAGCDKHYESMDLHIDHKIPRHHGGKDDIQNLQLLCGHCNSTKGTGTMGDLGRRLKRQQRRRRLSLHKARW